MLKQFTHSHFKAKNNKDVSFYDLHEKQKHFQAKENLPAYTCSTSKVSMFKIRDQNTTKEYPEINKCPGIDVSTFFTIARFPRSMNSSEFRIRGFRCG